MNRQAGNGKPPAIVVEHLTKRFGEFVADDDLNFTVAQGEIFGILGPNGAGKSTLIRMLDTLITPTSGIARVMGHDVAKETAAVRQEIGVISQANTVDQDLSAWESLDIYGKFYSLPRKVRRQRATELLEAVGLTEWKDRPAGTYSGGMRRRLEIARGLIHRPHVFILDEPTTGLDPQSRRVIWELLEGLRSQGDLTILLCTHYMDEADRLCDRLAIIDHGKIVALGTPRELKSSVPGQDILTVQFFKEVSDELLAALKGLPNVRDAGREEAHTARVILGGDVVPLEAIAEVSRAHGDKVKNMSLLEPTLEDVFLHYTGRGLRDAATQEYTYAVPTMMR
ncbi:MAG: ATP-binding cassette domain-containing protein [Candidatus Eisenbacteria bacterium]|uniref:ATP-binding cassette domain-containing protein n=1 Tax=Eiseniibacteriota bacterium TaxID=2212470 RepID=A0A538TRP9_UNCEI|nr:MAG: ATP-binding cassette domain-containing protein [Candidatus Eisenbacteria bacterium]